MKTDPGEEPAEERPAGKSDAGVYRVDASGAEGVLIGDQGTQINYFYHGTWSDGVVPPPLVGVSGTIDSPYRGLRAFGERDAALFFGREKAAAEVLELLSGCLEGTGLLVVSGVSGAGKSSLLNAGVLPRLRGAGLASAPEAAAWPCVVFTPTSMPLEELAVRIAPVAGTDASSVRQALSADASGFALTARQAALRQDAEPAGREPGTVMRRVLLVVDQFETLFTQCEREEERQAFVTALHAAVSARAAMVVLVVRADLEARLADYPALVSAVRDRYLLTAMTERQLRLAITRPADTAGSSVDDDLVQVLLEEVRTRAGPPGSGPQAIGAGVLPLLSHALDQAWRSRTGQALTLADYEQTGGIEGAVASSAQRAYAQLSAAQQELSRQVFIRLTATTADGVDIAVRAKRADLTAGKDPAQARDVAVVLETFAAERLLTLAAGTVEISHEVLLSAWPLLRDEWLAGTRADRAARTRLQATASEWARAARDRAYLYTGSRLDAAVQAAARIAADARHGSLGQDEKDFLRASQRAAVRRTRIRRGFTAGVLALAVGLAVVAVTAIQAGNAYLRERNTAVQEGGKLQSELGNVESAQLINNSRADLNTYPSYAAQDSLIAWALDPSSALARYAMRAAATNPLTAVLSDSYDSGILSVAISPDGKTLATSDTDNHVRLWDTATGQESVRFAVSSLGPSPPPSVGGVLDSLPVAFSPDGKVLAAGGLDGTMRLWNVATHKEITTLVSTTMGQIGSLAFSPDGRTLAVGSAMCAKLPGAVGCAELWNAATGKEIGSPFDTLHIIDITGSGAVKVAFAPNGKIVATADVDGTVRLWDAGTQRQASASFRSLGSGLDSVGFSPDGRTLVTGGDDGMTRLWNVAEGRLISAALPGGVGAGNRVNAVAFSPNGAMVASADENGKVRLWSVATRQQIGADLSGGTGGANAVVFTPDSRTLASGDDDGTTRLWRVTALTGRPTGPPIPAGADEMGAMAFGPGETLVTSDGIDNVEVWNAAGGPQSASPSFQVSDPQPPDSGGITFPPQLALSPDSKTLATGAGDGTVRLWDLASGKQKGLALPVPFDLSLIAGGVSSLAFGPGGKELAIGWDIGDVEVWDVARGQPVVTDFSVGRDQVLALALAFTRDGKALASYDLDGSLDAWELPSGTLLSNFALGDATQVDAAAFSPDTATLAVGTDDGTVQLWDTGTDQKIGNPITPGDSRIDSLAFDPGGKTLATGGGDGTVRMWDVSYLANTVSQLCADIGGSLSKADWEADLKASLPYQPVAPGLPYRKVCP